MSGRPCNPGSDLRQLWQLLLGNTPLPQCGVPEKQEGHEAAGRAPQGERPDGRKDGGVERNQSRIVAPLPWQDSADR